MAGTASIRRSTGSRNSEPPSRQVGLTLDPTYTAKAFAVALARAETAKPGEILYWHTLSTAPLERLLREREASGEAAPGALPRRLASLFKR